MSHDDLHVKIESKDVDIFLEDKIDVELTVDILPDVMVSVPSDELNILVDTGEIKIQVDNKPPDIELTLKKLPDVIVLPTTGLTGPMGLTGPQGEMGPRGFQGPEGVPGVQGIPGDTGATGPQGVKGDTGAQGPTGADSTVPGPQGPEGPIGTVYDADQIGTIKAFSGKTVPTNWMLADGRSLLRADYPQLFAAIGVVYGSADATHFNLPDLKNKFIYGAAQTDLSDVGTTGGSATHVLTKNELAAHNHNGATGTGTGGAVTSAGADRSLGFSSGAADRALGTTDPGGHAHDFAGYSVLTSTGQTAALGGGGTSRYIATNLPVGTELAGGHTHGVTDHLHWCPGVDHLHYIPGQSIPALSISSDGGDQAHNNMPPYLRIAQIIKVTGITIDSGEALVGATGPQGVKGDTGVQGPTGDTGIQGPAGSPLAITESATPPASPQVGDLWLYHPWAGVSWIFRYEPDQDATYPWQFVGGSAAMVSVDTLEFTLGFGVWFQFPSGPSMACARAGRYLTSVEHWFSNSAADWVAGHMGVGIGGASPLAYEHTKGLAHFNAGGSVTAQHRQEVVVAAGGVIGTWYHTTNVNSNAGIVSGHCGYNIRRLFVTPVRVA